MLQIGLDQHRALSDVAAANFLQRLETFLRQQLPEKCGGDIRGELALIIERTAKWGFTSERDVATFAVLALALDPAFDEETWAQRILRQQERTPAERAAKLYATAIRRAVVAGTPLENAEEAS